MINKEHFLDYLYNRLPSVYREEDGKIGLPLYRYLQSLSEGGFYKIIEDSNNFLTLVDPENCPDFLLPFLLKSFGLKYYPDIDLKYQRKFLNNIGALKKRMGTETAIRYLVSNLAGFEVDLFYERVYNEEGKTTQRLLTVNIHVQSIDEYLAFTTGPVIKAFLKSQLPFYITPVFNVILDTIEMTGEIYVGGASSQYTSTVLNT